MTLISMGLFVPGDPLVPEDGINPHSWNLGEKAEIG